MAISGASAIDLMLADPIGQVRSPVLINEMFAREGIDAVMVPLNVAADGIDEFWVGLKQLKNVRGLIVSVPFKAAACRLSDRAGPHATLIGTANAVRREKDGTFTCENFDGLGFAAALKKGGHAIASRRALLAGAGGAGSAIAFALASEGAAVITIADAAAERAAALAAAVTLAFPKVQAAAGAADPAGHDLIVNATPMGMKPDDPFPLTIQNLTSAMTVMDIVMKPRETPLLAHARALGCPVQYGAAMTDSQMGLWVDFLGLRG
jgi:shikimate dehydrogenase